MKALKKLKSLKTQLKAKRARIDQIDEEVDEIRDVIKKMDAVMEGIKNDFADALIHSDHGCGEVGGGVELNTEQVFEREVARLVSEWKAATPEGHNYTELTMAIHSDGCLDEEYSQIEEDIEEIESKILDIEIAIEALEEAAA